MEEFNAANAESLERLAGLVERLTDDDLALEMDDGWTVGAVFAHLAFWDLRGLTLLGRWEAGGVSPSGVDGDAVNDACRPILRLLPAAEVRTLVIDAARSINQALAQASPGLLRDIEQHAAQFHVSRAVHRSVHLDEIEARLAGRMPAVGDSDG